MACLAFRSRRMASRTAPLGRPSERLSFHFKIQELLNGLTFADNRKPAIVQHDLGYEGPAVIVRRHCCAVGPGVAHDGQVTNLWQWKLTERDEPAVVPGE